MRSFTLTLFAMKTKLTTLRPLVLYVHGGLIFRLRVLMCNVHSSYVFAVCVNDIAKRLLLRQNATMSSPNSRLTESSVLSDVKFLLMVLNSCAFSSSVRRKKPQTRVILVNKPYY